MPVKTRTQAQWKTLAQRRLSATLAAAQAAPALHKLGPCRRPWSAEVELVSSATMTRLNAAYRGKRYATDVLSFPAPPFFSETGYLGELVICLPTLKRQAREQKHAPETELDVLLVHGLIHLLGLD